MSTYENRKTLPRRITAALLILMMVLALMPADSTYAAADSSYGFQPEGADNTQNSMMMLDVCGIESFSKLQQTADAYINQVKGTIDGTKSYKTDAAPGKEGIYFSFTMSAGMNYFQETWFRQKNMDRKSSPNTTTETETWNSGAPANLRISITTAPRKPLPCISA